MDAVCQIGNRGNQRWTQRWRFDPTTNFSTSPDFPTVFKGVVKANLEFGFSLTSNAVALVQILNLHLEKGGKQ